MQWPGSAIAGVVVGCWATDLKLSIGEGSKPVINDFHNSASGGMILEFFEKKTDNALGMEYDF